MTIKDLLKQIENTYSDEKYVNVVGTAKAMKTFVKECDHRHIWHYIKCTLFVYQRTRFEIVFFKKEDEQTIKEMIKDKDLVLNALSPF